MAATATDMTREHYMRPEVKEAILRYCMNGSGSRALNADEHWYKGGKDPKTVMLRGPADYDATIERGRTLYATLDILEQAIFEQNSDWNKGRNKPETTLGDLTNCLAFTLSTDIDSLGDIRRNPSVKEAVEAAAQFHVDYLREKGIEKSVYCLYSGGGIYVHVHHGLFAVNVGDTELTPDEIREQYQVLCKAYNRLIGDISKEFFRKYPQHIGKVKFDQLNNQKRTFKTIFSIHKRHPFAVIPLDPKAIKIDFSRASLPLSDEVLAEGANWYKSFDPSEKKAIVTLLEDKMEEVRQHIGDGPDEEHTISRLPEPLEQTRFAPCIQNIIEKAQPTEGRHRALGILATYLYQMGWEEDAAFALWRGIADRCGVDARIFDTEFGRVSCPRCDTIQTGTGGYPSLNLSGTGFCAPDEHCKGGQWPGDYHNLKILNEMEPPEPAKAKEPIRLDDVVDIQEDDDGNIKKLVFSPTKAEKAILDKMQLAMSEDSEDIYRFDGQIFRADGKRIIDRAMCKAVGDLFNAFQLKETIRRVSNTLLEAPVIFEPDPYLLGVKNGVVDLRTGTIREYSSKDLILEQIDVTYDPAARCPANLAFVESITPDPITRLMLIDWFVATAIKEPLAYVLFLLGLGRNGKGIYEKLIKKFFGQASFRDMPLAEVEKNNFAASGFYRKRGWIASETGKKKSSIGTDFMKLVSGNGVIDGDRKNKSRIQFEPYFQCIVDSNSMPPIEDSSKGWEERFCKANLPFVFVPNPNPDNPLEKLRDPHLFGKLTTPPELSGLLNLIIFRAKEISKTKTITKRSGAEMSEEYQEQSASVGAFLNTFCEYVAEGPDFWTPLTPVYDAYKEWCGYKVGEIVDSRYFGKQLTSFCGPDGSSKIGKDSNRKSIRLYKRLNFDSRKYAEELKVLQLSMSTISLHKSTSCLHDYTSTDSDVYMSTSNTWIEIIRRFGDNTPKSSTREEKVKNHVEHVDNVDITIKRPREVEPPCRQDVDTHVDTPEERIVCAVCGADLTGHGHIQKGSKFFCAKVGCGYPAREKNEAKA